MEAIVGDQEVEGVRLRNLKTDARTTLAVKACFIFIGATPNSHLLQDLVPLDPGGHVQVSEWMETPLPGLFVAGDLRAHAARQVVSSAGDGATAAIRADHYLSDAFPA